MGMYGRKGNGAISVKKYKISNMKSEAQGIELRIISIEQPFPKLNVWEYHWKMYFYIILAKRLVMIMLRFELKKIFSKPVNKIAVVILAVVLCVVSYLAIEYVHYIDQDGNTITGVAAARALRDEKNQWAGYITEDVLSKVIDENAIINRSEESLSNNIQKNEKAFANFKISFYCLFHPS